MLVLFHLVLVHPALLVARLFLLRYHVENRNKNVARNPLVLVRIILTIPFGNFYLRVWHIHGPKLHAKLPDTRARKDARVQKMLTKR